MACRFRRNRHGLVGFGPNLVDIVLNGQRGSTLAQLRSPLAEFLQGEPNPDKCGPTSCHPWSDFDRFGSKFANFGVHPENLRRPLFWDDD